MTKQEKIELVQRLVQKGLINEAEVACMELHVSRKYLKRG